MRFDPSERNEAMRAMGLFYQIGTSMTICIVGCLFAGRWLDARLGTAPWLTLALLLVGMGAAIFIMFKLIISFTKRKPGE